MHTLGKLYFRSAEPGL